MKKERIGQVLGFLVVILLMALLVVAGCSAPAQAPAPSTAPAPAPAPSTAPAPAPKPSATAAPAPAPKPAEKPIELRFAHQNPATSRPQVKFIAPWSQQVEKATNGRVKITIYPNATLMTEKEQYPAVASGVIDITWVPTGVYPGRFPYTDAITLPFMTLSSGKVNGQAYSAGKVNSRMLWELYEQLPGMQKEWSEVKLLALAATAPSNIHTAKKPVHNLAELKGLKLRTLAGGETNALKALGASPVNMPITEVYESAQRGVLDGMGANLSQIQSFKLYDVLRYYTPVGIVGTTNVLVMNLQKWNSLPEDIQKAISGLSYLSGSEYWGEQVWGDELATDIVNEAKKAGKEMQVVNLDAGELDKWKTIAGKPLWDQYAADLKAKGLDGQKAVETLMQLSGKYKP